MKNIKLELTVIELIELSSIIRERLEISDDIYLKSIKKKLEAEKDKLDLDNEKEEI